MGGLSSRGRGVFFGGLGGVCVRARFSRIPNISIVKKPTSPSRSAHRTFAVGFAHRVSPWFAFEHSTRTPNMYWTACPCPHMPHMHMHLCICSLPRCSLSHASRARHHVRLSRLSLSPHVSHSCRGDDPSQRRWCGRGPSHVGRSPSSRVAPAPAHAAGFSGRRGPGAPGSPLRRRRRPA